MKYFLIALAMAFSPLAIAADQTPAQGRIDASLMVHDGVIDSFTSLEFRERTQHSMNFLVESAIFALEYYGHKEDADQARKEWKEQFANYLLSFQSMDLGDHNPLSQWLADFYKKLRLRFGDQMVKMMHLDDINTLNYAIPVAFQPKGDVKTGDTWDKLEYSLHFVPFVSVVTYWGSYAACFYFTKGEPTIRKYCKQIAKILRTGMKNWVAPKLSDFVYDKAFDRKPADLDIDRLQLRAEYKRQMGY